MTKEFANLKTLTIEQILPQFYRQTLSPAAVRLYSTVWFRMAYSNADETWLSDADASIKSRIVLKDIPAAQSELARSGLLRMVPGNGQTKYEFVTDPDDLDRYWLGHTANPS